MVRFLPAGESHVTVEFSQTIEVETNLAVHALARGLADCGLPGVYECVAAYSSLLVRYDPLVLPLPQLTEECRRLIEAGSSRQSLRREILEVPVLYGDEWGPDLADVARQVGMSENEVIAAHSERLYFVYMIGFLPGYPYLGGLNPRLSLPRLAVPRTKVPEGSVAIAELQSGIYPLTSPGGWHLLGRTPLRLFCPEKKPPNLVRAGQFIRFVPISSRDFSRLQDEVKSGAYVPRVIVESST